MDKEYYAIPIRAWLKKLGITQRELSRKTGISQTTIYRILSKENTYLSTCYREISPMLSA